MKTRIKDRIVKKNGVYYFDTQTTDNEGRPIMLEIEGVCDCGEPLYLDDEIESGHCRGCIWLLDK